MALEQEQSVYGDDNVIEAIDKQRYVRKRYRESILLIKYS